MSDPKPIDSGSGEAASDAVTATEEDKANCSYLVGENRYNLKPLEKQDGKYIYNGLEWNFCSYVP